MDVFQKGTVVHMVGIGGIGMSALRAFLVAKGCKVTGSDVSLKGHDASSVTERVKVVVISYAIPSENVEVAKAVALKIPVITYPEAVAEVIKGKKVFCVSGTHGKSTVTAMLAQILVESGKDPSVIVGTKVPALEGKNYRVGSSDIFVLEACEYREAFLNYRPDVLVITNVEPDHLDYYKTARNYYRAFKRLCRQVTGTVVVNREDVRATEILRGYEGRVVKVKKADRKVFPMQVFGEHNRLNAWQAIRAAADAGVKQEKAMKILASFKGTWRRLEYKGEYNGAKLFDDYGHHPTEILVTLRAIRERYPERRLVCVFQPHQYSRLHSFFKDFVKALGTASFVVIPNVYRARDSKEDMVKVNAGMLVDALNVQKNGSAVYGRSLSGTVQILKKALRALDVCVVMGAGDVTQVCPMLLQPSSTSRRPKSR